jgi:hypothetical protein
LTILSSVAVATIGFLPNFLADFSASKTGWGSAVFGTATYFTAFINNIFFFLAPLALLLDPTFFLFWKAWGSIAF